MVNKGNGPDSHSLGQIHSLQATLCLVLEEWSRFNNQGQAFLRADSFSPGYTLFSVWGMAQGEEWSRLRNQNNQSSLSEKNKPDSPSLMFYSEDKYSSRSHRCEWKIGTDDSIYFNNILCPGWYQMIVMETACLQTVEIWYCGGYGPLFVTMCHSLSSSILPWIDTFVFYQLILYQLSWRLSSWMMMMMLVMLPVEWSIVLKTIPP